MAESATRLQLGSVDPDTATTCPDCGDPTLLHVPLTSLTRDGVTVVGEVRCCVRCWAAPTFVHATACSLPADANGSRTHVIADGDAVTRCCHRTPFEVPRTDRLTVDTR